MTTEGVQGGLSVQHLGLRDFRGLKSLDFDCTQLNVILGVNGSGKTSILQALAISLSRLSSRIATGRSVGLKVDSLDIRNGAQKLDIRVSLTYAGHSYGTSIRRERVGQAKQFLLQNDLPGFNVLGAILQGALNDDAKTSVPVFAFLPVNRAVLEIPLRIRTRHRFDQVSAYEGAFESKRNFRTFFEWFREREDLENEQRVDRSGFRDPQLNAVRKAIEGLMGGYTELRVRRSPLRMVLRKGREELQVNQLSDGEKTLLATLGEIARRLAIANPDNSNPLSGSGVVMIDEVDLHLHPKWQRIVVQKLPEIFPNIQFFLTTHSPVIAGSVRPENLFVLSDGQVCNAEAYGQDVGLILSEIFDTPRRLESVQAELDELFKLIYDKQAEEAQLKYKDLAKEIGSTDPEVIRARTLLRRFQGG